MARLLALLALLLPSLAGATEIGAVRPIGVGLSGGSLGALEGRAYLYPTRELSVDLSLGRALAGFSAPGLAWRARGNAHLVELLDTRSVEVPVGLGLGLIGGRWAAPADGVRLHRSGWAGLHAVALISADLADWPAQIEISAGADWVVLPKSRLSPAVGLAVRYYP
ncbi:MAG: hypothetical protein JXX28_09990 [Deltaproteobacteria bacterium]|nr:hypothetical protein [Deltaproteobacteria bacterium]